MKNINGYVIYPDSVGKMDLAEATEYAKRRSAAELVEIFRVEDCDTEKTIARFAGGEEA